MEFNTKLMKLEYLERPWMEWTEKLPKTKQYKRHWVSIVDIEVELSDGYILKVPIGTIWDGASIPRWLWWLMKPIDEGAIGDLIHDELWVQKQKQLEYFKYNIFDARKFADDERNKWRKKLAPRKKIKNWITHRVIRLIGGFYYSNQIQIPK